MQFQEAGYAIGHHAIVSGKRGPFGYVVVRHCQIIGTCYNAVTGTSDPTANTEIVAIRAACKRLQPFELTNCEIFTSCEPCPVCLSANYWARKKAVQYANLKADAAEAGFDD